MSFITKTDDNFWTNHVDQPETVYNGLGWIFTYPVDVLWTTKHNTIYFTSNPASPSTIYSSGVWKNSYPAGCDWSTKFNNTFWASKPSSNTLWTPYSESKLSLFSDPCNVGTAFIGRVYGNSCNGTITPVSGADNYLAVTTNVGYVESPLEYQSYELFKAVTIPDIVEVTVKFSVNGIQQYFDEQYIQVFFTPTLSFYVFGGRNVYLKSYTDVPVDIGNGSVAVLGQLSPRTYKFVINKNTMLFDTYLEGVLIATGTAWGKVTVGATPGIALGRSTNYWRSAQTAYWYDVKIEDPVNVLVTNTNWSKGYRLLCCDSGGNISKQSGLNDTGSLTWYAKPNSRSDGGLCVLSDGSIFIGSGSGQVLKQTAGSGGWVSFGFGGYFDIKRDASNNVYFLYNTIYTQPSTIYKLSGGVLPFDSGFSSPSSNAGCIEVTSNNNFYIGTGRLKPNTSGGYIYKQTNMTGSFVQQGSTVANWFSISENPLNGDVYAIGRGYATGYVSAEGYIYKQTGGVGAFVNIGWSLRKWSGIIVAPTGDLFACDETSTVYRSIRCASDPAVFQNYNCTTFAISE